MAPNEPESIQEARRLSNRVTIGIIAASMSIVPLIMILKVLSIHGDWATMAWFMALAVGAFFVPWQGYMDAQTLLKEYQRQHAREQLGTATESAAATQDSGPLQSMADRVVELAGDDSHVREMVDGLLEHIHKLDRDEQSLRDAIGMHVALDGEEAEGSDRLASALARKGEARIQQCSI